MLARSKMKSIWFGLLVLLVACPGGNNGGGGGPVKKEISGTVKIAGTGPATVAGKAEFVPGEVLVTFKTDLSARSLSSLSVAGISMRAVRASSLERTSLYRSDTVRSQAGTLALVAKLKARTDVAWAEPNQILRATATPNDPSFNLQWHYNAINLPQTWDLEKGLTNPVTVAVVDTGLLTGHPDIQGKFLPGFDFIGDLTIANDGNGRDNNPIDSGDKPGGQSSYHGSHVAGTIAAATDNGVGVAGVSWGAKILPIRVLGDRGSTSDIIDGILWAAGLPVSGVPVNPNPAKVINLSLGGEGLCNAGSTLQRAFDQVNAQGAIVVVAAGNENVEAAATIPASCSGVITVGATTRPTASNPLGIRASYSNFGPRVDVMAPGGQGTASSNADEVLSLDKNDANGQFAFGYKQGTSMATPHVAGVIALMKSKNPTLSFSRALSILKRTARPLTATQCTGAGTAKLPSDCGAGLIDAQAALTALDTNPDFSLTLNPSSVIAKRGVAVQIQIAQSNIGAVSPASLQLLENLPGLTSSIANKVLSLTPTNALPFGTYSLHVRGTADGVTREVSLSLNLIDVNAPPPEQADVAGTFVAFLNYTNGVFNADNSDGLFLNKSGLNDQYISPELLDGTYKVIAWKDIDNDKEITKGDLIGGYFVGPDFALLRPPVNNINFDLDIVQSVDQINDPSIEQARVLLNAKQKK
jgi:serine protease